MPVDKNAVLNGNNGTSKPQAEPIAPTSAPTTTAPAPTAEESRALAALSQTAAGTIRQSIGAMNQIVEKLEDQRDMVTTHAAHRITAVLDPVSIQAEIATKTVSQLEGKSFVPFELEAIELPEVRRYVPQLPQSYASLSLPSSNSSNSPIDDASGNGTISPGKQPTAAGKGFGEQRKAS